ncbi:helix-turn-helix domain-containing protein, partial [Actinoplanes cyaneus]
MGRRPEVFVRALSMAEGQRLQKITRTAKNPIKLRRAIVVLMSGQGQPAPDIAYLLKATEDYVRDVIHAFNERGFDALDPKWRGGTPNKISEPFSSCVSRPRWVAAAGSRHRTRLPVRQQST